MMTDQPQQGGSGLVCIVLLFSLSIGKIFNYSLGICLIKIYTVFGLFHIHTPTIASYNIDL